MDIARTQFTFVPENPGTVELVLATRACSLERDAPQTSTSSP